MTLLELTEIETVIFDSKRCSLCLSDSAGVDGFRYLQAHVWLWSNLNSNEVIDSACIRTWVKLGGLCKVNCCLNHARSGCLSHIMLYAVAFGIWLCPLQILLALWRLNVLQY